MIEIRCKKCNKLLCKTEGTGIIEIKCPRCGEVNTSKGECREWKQEHQ